MQSSDTTFRKTACAAQAPSITLKQVFSYEGHHFLRDTSVK
jgi:hypothetical protein